MSSNHPDFDQYGKEVEAEILAGGYSQEQVLEQIKESLRELRLALPTYKQFQDEMRYTMTVEDVDEHEDTYKQLAADTIGAFEYQDYVDLLVRTRTTMYVMTTVLQRFAEGNAAKAARPAPRQAKGCGLTVALAVGGLAGVAAWLTGVLG